MLVRTLPSLAATLRLSIGLSLSLLSCGKTDTDVPACGDPATWNVDVDGDGFGSDQITLVACEAPAGFVAGGEVDCNDADAEVRPDGTEACNEVDDNCDGTVDEGVTKTTFYADVDGDGYGDAGAPVEACEEPDGATTDDSDCDDDDAAFNPDAPEDDCADALDYNCDGSVGFDDADGDGFAACDDCNDADDAINPDAAEICNREDDDCNGAADDSVAGAPTWYADSDGDGYGVIAVVACDAEKGWVALGDDCDDGDVSVHPYAPESDCDDPIDYNCDESTGDVDADADGFDACDDCNDQLKAVNPDAKETCNGIDDDCDGKADDGGGLQAWYTDADGDDHGDPATATKACVRPAGAVAEGDDCDDTDEAVYPGAVESCDAPVDLNCDGSRGNQDADDDGVVACEDCDDRDATINPSGTETCNGADDDCDGKADEGATDATDYYVDADRDGFGDAGAPTTACVAPVSTVANGDDCDDGDGAINPTRTEICNSADDDCDGATDEPGATGETRWYTDKDGDKYGSAADAGTVACTAPTGAVASKDDCDDATAGVRPGAVEICNSVDDDCDGKIDELGATGEKVWFADADEDKFGDPLTKKTACTAPAGYVADDDDCDDTDSDTNPDAEELCNGEDDDCNEITDDDYATDARDWHADVDGDGFGDAVVTTAACAAPVNTVADGTDCKDADSAVNPRATEVCDASNVDEDCDKLSDNADTSAVGRTRFYTDVDADTYGTGTGSLLCDAASGFVAANNLDCNDALGKQGINPAAQEVCDAGNIDEDCDGAADNADASAAAGGKTIYYADIDADTYRGASSSQCDPGGGYPLTASAGVDCDDTAAGVNPGKTEICNGVDDNCGGGIDEGKLVTYYRDVDDDEYGLSGTTTTACALPAGYAAVGGDCNDGAKGINPGSNEVCDAANADEDCDGVVEDLDSSAAGKTLFFADADNDTFGAGPGQARCDASTAYPRATGTDCNDGSNKIYPGATEIPGDGIDQDCNSADLVNTSCRAILAAMPGTPSGPQTLDPTGGSSSDAFVAYCDMTTAGGGWTLTYYVDAVKFDGSFANNTTVLTTAPTGLNSQRDTWDAVSVMPVTETLFGCTTQNDAATHYWRYNSVTLQNGIARATDLSYVNSFQSTASSTTFANHASLHKASAGYGFLELGSTATGGSCGDILYGNYHYTSGSPQCNSTNNTYGVHPSAWDSRSIGYPLCNGQQTSNGKFWIGVR